MSYQNEQAKWGARVLKAYRELGTCEIDGVVEPEWKHHQGLHIQTLLCKNWTPQGTTCPNCQRPFRFEEERKAGICGVCVSENIKKGKRQEQLTDAEVDAILASDAEWPEDSVNRIKARFIEKLGNDVALERFVRNLRDGGYDGWDHVDIAEHLTRLLRIKP